jgi:hypothetical protein
LSFFYRRKNIFDEEEEVELHAAQELYSVSQLGASQDDFVTWHD